MQLTTTDLKFLASKVLNQIDFDHEEYGLDEDYLKDIRDALLELADSLEETGEADILIDSDSIEDECGC